LQAAACLFLSLERRSACRHTKKLQRMAPEKIRSAGFRRNEASETKADRYGDQLSLHALVRHVVIARLNVEAVAWLLSESYREAYSRISSKLVGSEVGEGLTAGDDP